MDALIGRGHKVVVIAPPPHYPGGVLTSDDPGVQVGAVAQGRHGEVIWRSNFSPHDQSLRSRIVDQGVVAGSTMKLARRLIGQQRPDIILATAPPIPAAVAAGILGSKNQIPYVVDLRDVWPDLLQYMNEWGPRSSRSSTRKAALGAVFAAASSAASKALTGTPKRAAGITTTTPSFAELLRERGFVNVLNVRNLGSTLESPVEPLAGREDSGLRVLYVGTTGRAQGLHSALDAVEIVRDAG